LALLNAALEAKESPPWTSESSQMANTRCCNSSFKAWNLALLKIHNPWKDSPWAREERQKRHLPNHWKTPLKRHQQLPRSPITRKAWA